jgi:hypothetical protein
MSSHKLIFGSRRPELTRRHDVPEEAKGPFHLRSWGFASAQMQSESMSEKIGKRQSEKTIHRPTSVLASQSIGKTMMRGRCTVGLFLSFSFLLANPERWFVFLALLYCFLREGIMPCSFTNPPHGSSM